MPGPNLTADERPGALAPDGAAVEAVSEHFAAVLPRDSLAPDDRPMRARHRVAHIAP